MLLMRDYIHRALYSSPSPYFSKAVFAGACNLPFGSLLGRSEYDARVAALYAASSRGWLTPTELFSPWYSYGLAHCLLERAPASGLHVYEVGGGTGASACHVLDYIKQTAPALYARPGALSYTILEISPTLSERQAEALQRAGHHSAVARSLCVDAMRTHEHLHSPHPCTVIAMEVLDNLPHDKVVCLSGTLYETWVEEEEEQRQQAEHQGSAPVRREVYRPLADPQLLETWALMQEYGSSSSSSKAGPLTSALAALCRAVLPQRSSAPTPPGFQWALHAPTGALALLKSLTAALPAHSLLLADFSHLPHPTATGSSSSQLKEHRVACHAPADALPGCGGPPWAATHLRGLAGHPLGRLLASGLRGRLLSAPLLVASKAPGAGEKDHASYLAPPLGEADIFFPTDFGLLAHMVGGLGGRSVRVEASSDFLRRHARWERTATLTGFNPMLDTYTNTMFLHAEPSSIAREGRGAAAHS